MGLFDSLFGGGGKAKSLSDPQHQFYLASKIASLFDGFIVQAGAEAFLRSSTAVVLSREADVFISQAEKSKLSASQPLAYTQLSQLASYADVRDTVLSDPESSMLTMYMDSLAKDALRHLLSQVR